MTLSAAFKVARKRHFCLFRNFVSAKLLLCIHLATAFFYKPFFDALLKVYFYIQKCIFLVQQGQFHSHKLLYMPHIL